ncbi:PAS domain-containing sensor histidine kinase [Cellvibrio sp. PSBB023]|uniref:sensor histidine kinase n=1 Tax=Cellvibrio sp. PSBB023 TaxID=1945512 RepID=UPI00122E1825|nr:ATP-binding protein [Cellvibrio sp. PSBB023]
MNTTNRKFSLEGKLCAIAALSVTLGLVILVLCSMLIDELLAALIIALPIALTTSIWLVRALIKNQQIKIDAIQNGMLNLMDNDFSVSIANKGNDELSETIAIFNQLSEKLRNERQHIYQRELLLDMVIQNSNMGVVLIDQEDKIIYSNSFAKDVLNTGKPINGLHFPDAIATTGPSLKEVLSNRKDGLFKVKDNSGDELYHITTGRFILNARKHEVLLIKRMTLELHRQEATIWKKVIRTITHELNNSLAPISSMAHSGKLLVEQEKYDPLGMVFETIAERAQHLKLFIDGYARIAKLPKPEKKIVAWQEFITKLSIAQAFCFEGDIPTSPGYFDPVQIQQVITNLLKNAQESGSATDQIYLTLEQNSQCSVLQVLDRGAGMSTNTMENALLPFYTTKQSGSGIGLSLCREIVDAHGGHISLENRSGGGVCVKIILPNTPGQHHDTTSY